MLRSAAKNAQKRRARHAGLFEFSGRDQAAWVTITL
jgi:hypothetical protein